MKKMRTKYKSIVIGTVCSLVLLSCNKENEPTQPSAGGDLNNVSISILGVDDDLPAIVQQAMFRSSTAATMPTAAGQEIQTENFDNFSWDLSAESERSTAPGTALRSSTAALRQATSKPMADTVRFKIFVKEVGTNTYKSKEFRGTNDSTFISLEKDKAYEWFAFSYDRSDSIGLKDGTNGDPNSQNINVNTRTDAPFLYFKGTLPATSPRKIEITFKQQIAKVGVKVNAQGLFATKFNSLGGNFNLSLKKGTFNMATGTLATTGLTDVAYTGAVKWVDGSKAWIRLSTNEIYTASMATFQPFKMTFTDVQIHRQGTGGGDFTLVSASSPQTAQYTSTFHNAGLGFIKRAVVDLMPKQVDFGDGGTWGPGLLYYDSGDPLYPYKFNDKIQSVSQPLPPPLGNNYYWLYNRLYPRQGNSSLGNGDPCSKVAPAGSWRLPSYAEYSNSLGGDSFVVGHAGPGGNRYIQGYDGGLMFTSQDNKTYFPTAGSWYGENGNSWGISIYAGMYLMQGGRIFQVNSLGAGGSLAAIGNGAANTFYNIKCVRK